MEEKSIPEDEVPINVKTKYVFAFWDLLPTKDATPENITEFVNRLLDGAIRSLYAEKQKNPELKPASQQKPSGNAAEPLYVPARLSECAKELYR